MHAHALQPLGDFLYRAEANTRRFPGANVTHIAVTVGDRVKQVLRRVVSERATSFHSVSGILPFGGHKRLLTTGGGVSGGRTGVELISVTVMVSAGHSTHTTLLTIVFYHTV